MKIASFFILLIISTILFSQEKTIRYYEDGPLKFEDFKGKPLADDSVVTRLYSDIGFITKRLRVKDSILFVVETKNIMYPEVSFIRDSYRNSQRLAYNQLLFNMAEIERRKLQAKLIRKEDYTDAAEVLRAQYLSYQSKAKVLANKMRVLSDSSYIEYLYLQLDSTERIIEKLPLNQKPKVKPRNFKGGVFLGYSYAFADEKLSNYFNPNSGLSLGFDVFYKRVNLTIGVHLVASEVASDFQIGNELWKKEYNGGIDYGNFGLGYVIMDSKKTKVTPFVGFSSYTAYIEEEEEKYDFNDIGFSYGINYDYKFIKSVNFISVPYRETIEHYVKLRVSITQFDHNPIEGNLINLMIGYGYSIGGQKLIKD